MALQAAVEDHDQAARRAGGAGLRHVDGAVRVHRVRGARAELGLIEAHQAAVQRARPRAQRAEEQREPLLFGIVDLTVLRARDHIWARGDITRHLAAGRLPAVVGGESVVERDARTVMQILGVQVRHLLRVDDRVFRAGPQVHGLSLHV